MKNVIASYNSYKDNIYEGDPILVDQAFFNGIVFDSDNLTADVLFMIFSTDIKAVTIRFPIEFKNVFEFNKYKKEYGGSIGDYTLTMFRKNNRIPSVTVLSCFYKNREAITNENTFNLYASHSIGNTESALQDSNSTKVFKFKFRVNTFIIISSVLEKLKNMDYIPALVNDFNNTDVSKVKEIKLNGDFQVFVPEDASVFCFDPSRIRHRSFSYLIPVCFTKGGFDENNKFLGILLLTDFPRITKRKIISTGYKEFMKYQVEGYKHKYTFIKPFLVNYSMSADTPMTKVFMIGSEISEDSEKEVYLNMNNGIYEDLLRTLVNELT